MTHQFSSSDVLSVLRKELDDEKIGRLLSGLEVSVNLGTLAHILDTAVLIAAEKSEQSQSGDALPQATPIEVGAIVGNMVEQVEMTFAEMVGRIGDPSMIGDERSQGAQNALGNTLKALRERFTHTPARPSMRYAEYALRREIYKIGSRIEGEVLEESDLIQLGRDIQFMSGVCPSCGGDGRDGDAPDSNGEGGGIWTCAKCKGAGIIVPADQFDPDSHDF